MLIAGFATTLVMRPGLGPIAIHDNLAVYWVWADQFTSELGRGNFYPRWLPASYQGLGAPVFYYYPPLAFYLVAVFGLAGLSTYSSLIAAFACAFAASGFSCWMWLRGRSNHPLLGACLFMAAPYHMFDYVDRGALPECVGIALIPVLAIGLRRIAERRGGIALTSVSYALLIGAHLPLALLTSLFFVGPHALQHRRNIRAFALSIALGIGLAAIYLVPALALAPFHDRAQLYRTPFFLPSYWNVLNGNWTDPTYVRIHLICAAVVLTVALIIARRRCGWALYAVGLSAIVAGIVPGLWSIPLLKMVQFPFRALPLAEFALATAIARLPIGSNVMLMTTAPSLLVSALILPGLHAPARNLERMKSVHPDVYEYLPEGVLARGETDARLSDVLARRLPTPRVKGMVVEPRFYFPAWSCGRIEPRTQLLMHDPDCRPQIRATAPEKLGATISLLSMLMLLVFVSPDHLLSAWSVRWKRRKKL